MGAEGFILANPWNARFLKGLTHSAVAHQQNDQGWGFLLRCSKASQPLPPWWAHLADDTKNSVCMQQLKYKRKQKLKKRKNLTHTLAVDTRNAVCMRTRLQNIRVFQVKQSLATMQWAYFDFCQSIWKTVNLERRFCFGFSIVRVVKPRTAPF